MDVRVKLIDLLDRFVDDDWYSNEEIADKLIERGVTVQEWISVNDRLPEKNLDVFALSNKNGGHIFVGYRGYISGDWMENGSLHIGDVTHWIPLPEPPKGE